MKDKYGFEESDMTPDGWRDYQRALSENSAQRDDKICRYNGVSRVHCSDGYVDIRQHGGAVVNGSSSSMTVDGYRAYARKRWDIDDYSYRDE